MSTKNQTKIKDDVVNNDDYFFVIKNTRGHAPYLT